MNFLCFLVISGFQDGFVILFYYLLFGYNDTFLSLSHGPISRILITQVATLFLHFDAFPPHWTQSKMFRQGTDIFLKAGEGFHGH